MKATRTSAFQRGPALLAALLLFLPLDMSAAPAAVIYQHAPNPSSGAFRQSSVWGENGSDWDQVVWDSFILSSPTTIREIQWRGGYFRGPAAVTNFEVSIWPSIPAGIQPDIIAGPLARYQTTGNANQTPAGTAGGVAMYDYKFTLPAGFAANAGTKYWVQIFAFQNNLPGWGLADGLGGNGSHFRCISAAADKFYQSAPGDTAFALLDQATVPVTITVNRNPTSGGTVTGAGIYPPGTMVTVTATPASGRSFISWTESNVVVSTNTSYTFSADGPRTLVANFTGGGVYVITAVANPGVGGTVGGAGTFNPGELVDLDASPADGLQLVSWTEDGEIVATTPRYQFPASRNRNLVANFTNPAQQYFIYTQASPANAGYVWGGGTHFGGTQIWIGAEPMAGFHFVNWKQGNTVLSTVPDYLLTVVLSTTLTATFAPDPVIIVNLDPPEGGTVDGGGPYPPGSEVTLSANAAIGYIFTNWTEGATVVSTSANYVFTISNSRSLVAHFAPLDHLITTTASPPAAGETFGDGTYGHGATVMVTAVPASGYDFVEWTLGEVQVSTEATFTFEALANYTLVAHFASAPKLNVFPAGAGVIIVSWPASATNWVLQESIDLMTWSDSTRPISVVDGFSRVTATNLEGRCFFRLVRP